ncbi:hypothetical protein A4X13_0g4776 [Tilletia indica]|uniref:F-box domain-containing protein n=1 Tax=Tilletia indica TaxID=43049 RepID=A0A177TAS5_9BASI|nr:hypothetical protein A4X13_0g4776 [Tilletia indica]
MISAASFRIEDLRLRLPCDQRVLNVIGPLLAKQVNLFRVHLEVQSGPILPGSSPPRLHLEHTTLPGVKYQPFHVFVLRAPSCVVYFLDASLQQPFKRRAHNAFTFRLACNGFATPVPNWLWAYEFLRASPRLEHFELNVDIPDDRSMDKDAFNGRDLHLPHLIELIIQLPDVDSYLFRLLRAPRLYALRIRSSVERDLWPDCDENGFPNLFLVNVKCPGPTFEFLYVLGVPTERFGHNRRRSQAQDGREGYMAYIKPYDVHRPATKAPPYLRAQLPLRCYYPHCMKSIKSTSPRPAFKHLDA